MKGYMKESFIIRSIYGLYQYFLSSCTCKILEKIHIWYKCSSTRQILNRYMHRTSSLKYSATYSIFSNVFSSADRFRDRLCIPVGNVIDSSFTISLIKKSLPGSSRNFALPVFILFLSCGYGITSILLGNFNYIRLALVILGFLVSIFLPAEKPIWTACRKNSLFWHIYIYFFD